MSLGGIQSGYAHAHCLSFSSVECVHVRARSKGKSRPIVRAVEVWRSDVRRSVVTHVSRRPGVMAGRPLKGPSVWCAGVGTCVSAGAGVRAGAGAGVRGCVRVY